MEHSEPFGIHAFRELATYLLLSTSMALVACSPDGTPSPADPSTDLDPDPTVQGLSCTIPVSQVYDSGVGRDGIPALTDPELVDVGDLARPTSNPMTVSWD